MHRRNVLCARIFKHLKKVKMIIKYQEVKNNKQSIGHILGFFAHLVTIKFKIVTHVVIWIKLHFFSFSKNFTQMSTLLLMDIANCLAVVNIKKIFQSSAIESNSLMSSQINFVFFLCSCICTHPLKVVRVSISKLEKMLFLPNVYLYLYYIFMVLTPRVFFFSLFACP